MKDFVIRRNEKVNGRSRIEEVIVWESLRLNIAKKCGETGNPMASKRDRRWKWILFCKEMESGERNDERRTEAENGSAKRDTFVK